MSQWFIVVALILAFSLPLLHVLWWPSRGWQFWILLAGLIMSGWMLIMSDAMVLKYSYDADMYARAAHGMPVSVDEILNDGNGENAFAVVLGWVIPLLGVVVGWCIQMILPYARYRLRNASVASTGSDPRPTVGGR